MTSDGVDDCCSFFASQEHWEAIERMLFNDRLIAYEAKYTITGCALCVFASTIDETVLSCDPDIIQVYS